MSETVCIIPARGGSKGIPGKNIVNFCGAPLVTWNIQAALESKSIDRTFVSTDSAEIAEIAKAQGAEVINRPVEISGDTASSESALLHALNVLKEDGYSPEILVFLQCTSPLTTSDDIDGTIKLMKNKNADSAFTCARFYEFLWRCDETGNVNNINHDKRKSVV